MLWESENVSHQAAVPGMRWGVTREDANKKHSIPNIQNGSTKQSYRSAYGYRKTSQMDDFLMHYGVPGMKWGVITKEYIKKGLRSLGAPPSKKVREKQRNADYNFGYNLGKRRAERSDIIQSRVKRIQAQWKKDHPDPDIVDRLVKKGMDNFGLGAYSQQVSKKLKDTASDKALDYLKTQKGQATANAAANALAKPLAALLRKTAPGAQKLADKLRNLPKSSLKASWKGAKALPRILKSAQGKTIKWLRFGGPERLQKGAKKVAQLLGKYGSLAADNLDKVAVFAEKGAQYGGRTVYKALNIGTAALLKLMRRRL